MTEANAVPEPIVETVPKAEYDSLAAKLTTLEASHKSLQKTLHNERQRGGDTSALAAKIDANQKLTEAIAEAMGKLGVEGLDLKPVIAEVHKTAESKVDPVRVAAGEAIVAAFETAGISRESFEEAWSEDRFKDLRGLWDAGKFADTVPAAIKVLMTKTESKPEVFDKAAVDAAVTAAVAADRQARAATVDTGPKTTSKAGMLTRAEIEAMTPDERQANLPKIKEAMRAGVR